MSRPDNGRVLVSDFNGDAVAAYRALRKRVMDTEALAFAFRRHSPLYEYVRPGQARRIKASRARLRLKQAARRRAQQEARHDPDGRRPRPVAA